MMPATIARAASAGDVFSSVSTSPILVSIGPGYTPNTCVFCPQHRARDLRERVRRGLRGAVRRENREADARGHRVEVGDGAAAILREYCREGPGDRDGDEG